MARPPGAGGREGPGATRRALLAAVAVAVLVLAALHSRLARHHPGAAHALHRELDLLQADLARARADLARARAAHAATQGALAEARGEPGPHGPGPEHEPGGTSPGAGGAAAAAAAAAGPVLLGQTHKPLATEMEGVADGASGAAAGLWGGVSAADRRALAKEQLAVYKRFVLRGFRNWSTTDFYMLRKYLGLTPPPGDGGCATFDIGANIGKYIEDLKKLPVTKHCRILAFEPNPEVFKRLMQGPGTLPRVEATNAGVGSEAGSLSFYFKGGSGDTGGSFDKDNMVGERTGVDIHEVTVDVLTLDDVIRERVGPGEAIPLVKMDVEGHEQAVKEGMVDVLRSGRVGAVYWERQGAHMARIQSFKDEVDFMARLGYLVYILGCVPPGGTLPRSGRVKKHSCSMRVVRVDGELFHDQFDPGLYRAAGRDGTKGTGKPSSVNLLGVRAGHPFNDYALKTLALPVKGAATLPAKW